MSWYVFYINYNYSNLNTLLKRKYKILFFPHFQHDLNNLSVSWQITRWHLEYFLKVSLLNNFNHLQNIFDYILNSLKMLKLKSNKNSRLFALLLLKRYQLIKFMIHFIFIIKTWIPFDSWFTKQVLLIIKVSHH